MIKRESFGDYEKFILSSGEMELEVTDLGATVTGLRYKGRELVLSMPEPKDYLEGSAYICACIGRYANRIGGARFSLGGREYMLSPNEGRNQLHGGPDSLDKRRWKAEEMERGVKFSIFSPHGDNGFPGNLEAALSYSLDGNELRLNFEARADMDTVYAPTSHMYFTLDGGGDSLDYELMINSDSYLETDSELIPTGRLLPARGSHDFRALRRIGLDLDTCFVLKDERACLMRAGGVSMELHTDFPALQVYTSSGLSAPFAPRMALALEPEFYPDSPNHENFPSTLLKKGELFHKYISFRFQ